MPDGDNPETEWWKDIKSQVTKPAPEEIPWWQDGESAQPETLSLPPKPWYELKDAKPKVAPPSWIKELKWTQREGTAIVPSWEWKRWKETLVDSGEKEPEKYRSMSYAEIEKRIAGWKLHLNFDPTDTTKVDTVASTLLTLEEQGLISTFKVGHHSGQKGKEATVYVGHRDKTQFVAEVLEKALAENLDLPSGDALVSDIEFTPHVMGRFEITNVDPEFDQYGVKGYPLLSIDKGNLAFTDKDDPQLPRLIVEARDRADTILRTRYGEFYTGTQSDPEPNSE